MIVTLLGASLRHRISALLNNHLIDYDFENHQNGIFL